MRVLPAILTDTRHIAADVSGIEAPGIEGRVEQLYQAQVAPDQMLVDSRHGPCRPGHLPRTGNDTPTLRDRVDLAFHIPGRAQRRPIIKIRPAIPLPIP